MLLPLFTNIYELTKRLTVVNRGSRLVGNMESPAKVATKINLFNMIEVFPDSFIYVYMPLPLGAVVLPVEAN